MFAQSFNVSFFVCVCVLLCMLFAKTLWQSVFVQIFAKSIASTINSLGTSNVLNLQNVAKKAFYFFGGNGMELRSIDGFSIHTVDKY